MKRFLALLLMLCLTAGLAAAETAAETLIVLGKVITVNSAPIPEDAAAPVHLARVAETHEDVPTELAGLENRVVTITGGGVYRVTGTAADTQIAVKAGSDEDVRLILDGVDLTCRTHAAIAVYSARDPRVAGEYGVTIELAAGSVNVINGSHNAAATDEEPEFDGAIGSQVSLGFEGAGSLTVTADKEGVEVASGHMTIQDGVIRITAGDDPLNVSEDGVGVLTMNGGYVYSAVRNTPGGEGDGIDSNGRIVFNGGTAINLAHPTSQDGGIDSDMGSVINGGVIVGAGNMYDPIETDSAQLFMMLEFSESTDDLLVVTDAQGKPVFAFDFPYDYMYIAFSTPDLVEGAVYHVYLGGEIVGEQQDGLYTSITAYTPGSQLTHGAGVAEQRGGMTPPDGFGGFGDGARPEGFGGGQGGQRPEGNGAMIPPEGFEGGQGTPPEGFDPGAMTPPDGFQGGQGTMPEGFDPGAMTPLDGFQGGQGTMPEGFDPGAMTPPDGFQGGQGTPPGGFGGMPRAMTSSSDVATGDFVLTRESCTFSNLTVMAAGE